MLDPDDTQQIIAAVDEVIARRMEEVYGVLEDLREQMSGSIQMLNGNDQALVGELQRIKGGRPEELLDEVNAAWEGFIAQEAERLGITRATMKAKKIIAPRAREEGDDG